jgi:hypothetical protein
MSAVEVERAVLSPEQAVQEVLRIEFRTRPLVQRTVGLTWMIWAFVNGGIFATCEEIGIAGSSNPWYLLGESLAWAPWVLMGAGATWVLWRSLAVVLPTHAGGIGRITALATGTFLALTFGALLVATVANAAIDQVAFAMIAIAIAAAVVGGSGLTADSRSERSFWIAGGGLVALLAVGLGLVAPRLGDDPLGLLLVLGPVATTALLFGGGLYTAAS